MSSEAETAARVRATSMSRGVYEHLRQAIVQGRFRPNERLVEVDVAEELSISRTPVREALQLLASDGLVTSRKRGWVVREHTAGEISDIYEVRMALEGFAFALAARNATPEELERIEAAQNPEGVDLVTAPREALVYANSVFHNAVIQACHNDRLIEYIRRNSEFYFNHRIAVLYTEQEAQSSIEGHAKMVEAIKARDAGAAESLIREHISDGLQIILVRLR